MQRRKNGIVRRRCLAIVLALMFAGPLAGPLAGSARAGCARCAGAAHCCCAPARGQGGGALARPCGPGSRDDSVPAPLDLQKALPETFVIAWVPPAPASFVRTDVPPEPANLPPVPPDPPPRISL